jgi:hypothetical protein
MAERRITNNGDHTPKLKQIAGLFQSLSFREMNELAAMIDKQPGEFDTPEVLLAVCDEILTKDQPLSVVFR